MIKDYKICDKVRNEFIQKRSKNNNNDKYLRWHMLVNSRNMSIQ